jgi:hypothetical protein
LDCKQPALPLLSDLFIKMRVEDYSAQGRRGCVRLHEKSGKRHEMPCNHNLQTYLDPYISAAGLVGGLEGYLFWKVRDRGRTLPTNPLDQADVYGVIRRRAFAAGIKTRIGNHTFLANGITQYLRNAMPVGARSRSRWQRMSRRARQRFTIGGLMRWR